MSDNHQSYMLQAIEQAKIAKQNGDWPFGAVVVRNDQVVGRGAVKDKTTGNVTDHAEIVAIRDACFNLHTNDLSDCTIYCTNEPCLMCASTIFQAKISNIYIGVSRQDLNHLLRPRKLKIDDLANDSGLDIHITKGLLKETILELFKNI